MMNGVARKACLALLVLGVASASAGQVPVSPAGYADPATVPPSLLTRAELSDLVAPVALYPDSLMGQVLVASTYPLEVVQAHQWRERNGHLEGSELMDAARRQPWDASVQGLVAFADVLSLLAEDVAWTTALGNAFLAQQPDLMNAVQELRARAHEAGRLVTSPQQTVSTVVQEGRTVIEIVPADPQVVYVPRYDPYYVWGAPAWVAYPPLSYGYGWGYGFGVGIHVGYWFGGWNWGWGWGWGPNWWGGSVWVDPFFFRHCGYRYRPYNGHHGYNGRNHGGHEGGPHAGGHGGREAWKHDSAHRRGVPYSGGREAGRNSGGSRDSRSVMTQASAPRRPEALRAAGAVPRPGSAGTSGERRYEGWREPGRASAPEARGAGADAARRSASRAVAPGTRGDSRDEGWRTRTSAAGPATRSGAPDTGGRTGARPLSGTRGLRADRGWSAPAEGERRRAYGAAPGRDSRAAVPAPSSRDAWSRSRSAAPQGHDLGRPSRGTTGWQRSPTSTYRPSEASPRGRAPSSTGYSAPPRSSSGSTYRSAPAPSGRSGGSMRSQGSGGPRGSAGGSGPRASSGGGRRH